MNRRNSFNMRALDVVRFSGDPNPDMIQIIKDVGGVSSQDNMPQPETGEGQMDTGDEQTMSNPGVYCVLSAWGGGGGGREREREKGGGGREGRGREREREAHYIPHVIAYPLFGL